MNFPYSAKDEQADKRQESAEKENGLKEEESMTMTKGHLAVEVLRRENRVLRQQARKLQVEIN